jgi:hypothetical protein
MNFPTTATQFCDTTLRAAGAVMSTARCDGSKADGTTAAGTTCTCGTNNVQIGAAEFCFVKTDLTGMKIFSAQPACPANKSTGLVVAGADCFCGTSNLPTTATQFCDTTLVATGTVMTTARCDGNKADGTTVSGAICSCGTNNGQTPADKWCFVKESKVGLHNQAAAMIPDAGCIVATSPAGITSPGIFAALAAAVAFALRM